MMDGFYYLATPYSKFPGGTELAYRLACMAAAECFREGIVVYSPIAHTHSIAEIGNIGLGYDIWQKFDEAMMAAARGLIVVTMEGWQESVGVRAEIAWCRSHGKPIMFRREPCQE